MLTRKKLMFIGILVVILVSLFIMNKFSSVSPIGTKLTEEKLFSDLERIGQDKVKIKHVQLSRGESLLKETQFESERFPEDSRLVEIFIQNRRKEDFLKPLEVEHALRIWLYLEQHELPFPIIGVRVYIDEKWVNDKELPALIFRDDFDELYKSVNSQLENEFIEKMSQSWILEHNYQRRDMK